MAYEMLTGFEMFGGRSAQQLLQLIHRAAGACRAQTTLSATGAVGSGNARASRACLGQAAIADEMLHVLDNLATPSAGMTHRLSRDQSRRAGNLHLVPHIGVSVALLIAAVAAVFFMQRGRGEGGGGGGADSPLSSTNHALSSPL